MEEGMTKTGTIQITLGEARLDGELLAIKGANDPLGEGTNFLGNSGLGDGDQATVTGSEGLLGNVAVFFMTSAQAAAALAGAVAPVAGGPKKAPAKKKAVAKKAAKKKAATTKHPAAKTKAAKP
jgi:hypothetical protein